MTELFFLNLSKKYWRRLSWNFDIFTDQISVDLWYVIKYTWYYNKPLRNLFLQFFRVRCLFFITAPVHIEILCLELRAIGTARMRMEVLMREFPDRAISRLETSGAWPHTPRFLFLARLLKDFLEERVGEGGRVICTSAIGLCPNYWYADPLLRNGHI